MELPIFKRRNTPTFHSLCSYNYKILRTNVNVAISVNILLEFEDLRRLMMSSIFKLKSYSVGTYNQLF